MLELNCRAFLGAVAEMRTLILNIQSIGEKTNVIGDQDKILVTNHLDQLIAELEKIGSRSALISATRVRGRFAPEAAPINYADLQAAMVDIESRFADHLDDVKLFYLHPEKVVMLQPVDDLLSVGERPVRDFSLSFPNASFEIEEAAKCWALSRYTASVFHSMRALECGIRSLCKFLSIPDATRPAEKNWAIILKSITQKVDENWPRNTRVSDSMGARFEALLATLDTVKNPWRNATMHVETIYAPHEALHILRCTSMFLLELYTYCDEEGRGREKPAAAASSSGQSVESQRVNDG